MNFNYIFHIYVPLLTQHVRKNYKKQINEKGEEKVFEKKVKSHHVRISNSERNNSCKGFE